MAVPANVIVLWPSSSGSIPTGWSAVSNYNSRFLKGTTGDSTSTGGGSTHTHSSGSHTHSETSHGHGEITTASANGGAPANGGGPTGGGGSVAPTSHRHRGTPSNSSGTSAATTDGSWNSDNHEPSYYSFICIKSNGTPRGLPNGCVTLHPSNSAPTGWATHSASQGKIVVGSSEGGSSVSNNTAHSHSGMSSHTHTGGAHSHGSVYTSTQVGGGNSGEKGGVTLSGHSHPGLGLNAAAGFTSGSATRGSTGSNTPEPPWKAVHPITNNSGSDNDTIGVICLWEGSVSSIPEQYILCNGSNTTPDMNNRFLKMGSGNYNSTGGSTTHSHSAPSAHTHTTSSHTHTSTTLPNNTTGQCYEHGYGSGTHCTHTHNAAASVPSATASFGSTAGPGASSANHEPAWRYIRYIKQVALVSDAFTPTVTMF